MNNKKRKTLKKAITHLDTAASIIRDVIDEEQYSLDNMPENLETSARYADMEDAISIMEDLADDIEMTKDKLETELL